MKKFAALVLTLVAAEPLIYDLNVSEDWQAQREWLGSHEDNSLLLDFFTPWCGHCRRLLPELEAAAQDVRENWNATSLRIAKIDCSVRHKMCSAFGVTSYPTIFWVKGQSMKVAREFPNGPRRKVNLLAFMADQLQGPIEIKNDSDFDEAFHHATQCITGDVSIKDQQWYHCVAHQINNVVLATETSMAKVVANKLHEKHIVLTLAAPNVTLSHTGLHSTDDKVCWIDSTDRSRWTCVEDAKAIRDIGKRWEHPLMIANAQWDHFFQARSHPTKFTVVAGISQSAVNNYQLWIEEFRKLGLQHGNKIILLLVEPGRSEVMRLFEQLEVDASLYPAIVAFASGRSSHKFFSFGRRDINLLPNWIEGIVTGKIRPQSAPGHRSWTQKVAGEVNGFITTMASHMKQGSINAYVQAASIAGAIILGAVVIVFYFTDDATVEDERIPELEVLMRGTEPLRRVPSTLAPSSSTPSSSHRGAGDTETREPSETSPGTTPAKLDGLRRRR